MEIDDDYDIFVDLDLESDPINDFFKAKLKGMKLHCEELEKSLSRRKEIKLDYQQKCQLQASDANEIQIFNEWKKIANNKYVLGFKVSGRCDIISKINVILNWNSAASLNYKYHKTSATKNEFYIVVTMDLPIFLEQLNYAVSGQLICRLSKAQKMIVKMPAVQLNAKDFTDNAILLQTYRIVDGHFDDFMSAVYSCEKFEFELVYPSREENEDGKTYSSSLSRLMEFDCCFTKLIFDEARWFLVNKISSVFDGCFLEIDSSNMQEHSCGLNIYYRQEDALFALIHYLHTHLIDAAIVPKGCHQRHNRTLSEKCELLKRSMVEEIECSARLMAHPAARSDLIECKRKLLDLERKTDGFVLGNE